LILLDLMRARRSQTAVMSGSQVGCTSAATDDNLVISTG